MKILNITNNEQGQRLDKYLLKYLNNASKSFIYKMLRKKRIKYNGKKAEGNEIIKDGDLIQMYLSDETINNFMSEKIINKVNADFNVIFEDENIIICNKPCGLITHPDNQNDKNTLNSQLLYYLYEKGEFDISKQSVFTPSVCNRLDRNTSGIVVMGKNLASSQELNKAFKNKNIEKYYIAVVKGEIDKSGKIEGFHIKYEDNKVKIYDNQIEGSKPIQTEYEPLSVSNGFTLVRLKLITGKSHQIRAGLKHLGYPIIGDRKYGNDTVNKYFKEKFNLDNQFLHAYKLIFNINDGCLKYLYKKEFTADFDKKMNLIINEMNLKF